MTSYKTIYSDIAREIASGDYHKDERLPTEFELVKQYGVSRATVSRAMQALAREGLVTRRRGAGTFVSASTEGQAERVVVFFTPFISPDETAPYVEGRMRHFFVEAAASRSLLPRLQPLYGTPEMSFRQRVSRSVEQVLDSGACAVLYYPVELRHADSDFNQVVVSRLEKAGVEVVLADRDVAQPPERSKYPRVGFDNFNASARLVQHLYEQGGKRFAFVGLDADSSSATERMEGFVSALADKDVASQIWKVDRPGREHVQAIVRDFGADAIVCKSDRFAAEVGKQLHAMGVAVGQDVMLAGFDDDPIASLLPTPLTTVRLNDRAFAEAAAQMVNSRLDGSMPACTQLLVDCDLVIRESTRLFQPKEKAS